MEPIVPNLYVDKKDDLFYLLQVKGADYVVLESYCRFTITAAKALDIDIGGRCILRESIILQVTGILVMLFPFPLRPPPLLGLLFPLASRNSLS